MRENKAVAAARVEAKAAQAVGQVGVRNSGHGA